MMPRNIEHSDTLWHCRKVTADEWCAGFWPGVLWMDYEYTHDETLRAEAERFTASLEYLSKRPRSTMISASRCSAATATATASPTIPPSAR